jgi:UDPglucose--hexose-1-phosphate uridylyltransferase
MCPSNARASGERNPPYRGVFVFDNDFPALAGAPDPVPADPHPLFIRAPERGRCRVIAFSDRHDLHLGSLPPSQVESVVDAWGEESRRLASEEWASYVQIFENRVPTIPRRKAERLGAYFEDRGRDLLGDYLEEEARRRERIVEETEHWVQLVPFWAVWPFETMLIPKRAQGDLANLTPDERSDLARLLIRLVRRYDRLFDAPFPYSMGWYQCPGNGIDPRCFRLHAVYLPPLLRSSSVRKFQVGYELTAEPQRDFAPEEAASLLRAVRS